MLKRIENILEDGIGFIELMEVMGNDNTIVNTARLSYLGDSKGQERDKKLLMYLWENKHTSPFESVVYRMRVKCPLFVRSQWMRHRTASYNEISRRYTSEELEFYIPEKWRTQDTKNKQSSVEPHKQYRYWSEYITDHTNNTLKIYEAMLADNIAREQARMILPQSMYTMFYVVVNLHNLMHFVTLRNSSHAQWEIKVYAEAILEHFIKEQNPWVYEAYTTNE